jgi:hypothetical protein
MGLFDWFNDDSNTSSSTSTSTTETQVSTTTDTKSANVSGVEDRGIVIAGQVTSPVSIETLDPEIAGAAMDLSMAISGASFGLLDTVLESSIESIHQSAGETIEGVTSASNSAITAVSASAKTDQSKMFTQVTYGLFGVILLIGGAFVYFNRGK